MPSRHAANSGSPSSPPFFSSSSASSSSTTTSYPPSANLDDAAPASTVTTQGSETINSWKPPYPLWKGGAEGETTGSTPVILAYPTPAAPSSTIGIPVPAPDCNVDGGVCVGVAGSCETELWRVKDVMAQQLLTDRHSAHEHSIQEAQLEELRNVFRVHLPRCHCSFDVH
jgi:hypothetical protein